jgi:Ca2+-binding EF-hand superfamily protein
MAGEFISFAEATAILKNELNFPQERAEHFVKRFDHNKDGKLSTTEFNQFKTRIEDTKSQLTRLFKQFDRDGNGYITLMEASSILQKDPFKFPPGKVLALLKQFDKDGNGKLDIEEFAGFYAEAKATNDEVASRFEQLDADHNGVLSPEEVVNVLQEMLGLDAANARHMIEMFDTNRDGSLDKTEFMALWSSMFGN